MNVINPRKLYLSKWTAVKPINKEKHFLVSKVIFDEENNVTLCLLEAVMTHREYTIDWRQLKQASLWQHGWK